MAKIDLRKEAKDRPCQVNVPDICCRNTETTVLAHKPSGKKAVKADDKDACWACFTCHKWLDEDWALVTTKDVRNRIFDTAIKRTQRVLMAEGKL